MSRGSARRPARRTRRHGALLVPSINASSAAGRSCVAARSKRRILLKSVMSTIGGGRCSAKASCVGVVVTGERLGKRGPRRASAGQRHQHRSLCCHATQTVCAANSRGTYFALCAVWPGPRNHLLAAAAADSPPTPCLRHSSVLAAPPSSSSASSSSSSSAARTDDIIVALGKFDAMHVGHRSLAAKAAAMGGQPCLLSFR